MTNGEIIRGLTDEELSVWLADENMCEAVSFYTDALTALREQQERDKGCDFCLDQDGDNCDNGLYIDYTYKAAITTHDVYVPIAYCPMCGKKLEAEK